MRLIDVDICEDDISRKMAIEAVKQVSENYTGKCDREWHPHIDFIIDALRGVPSYNQANRKGEWIDIGGYEVCKNCHEVKRFPHWNFCPNCGADMRGE